ncbi:cytochrome P450 monooxygenase pc-bph [Irpex rosettiformis]|uniref:Cytochrome P450 monooxygenase pc-bph n=1 Tax=Irpex rosettiformis TaxID=378272 RepID=A0ACB8UC45_9APHY|nr:cytochrome P450 monooxygenase pc-bph [Irpex rosettiformis]
MIFTDFLTQLSGSQLSQSLYLLCGAGVVTSVVVASALYYIVPYLQDPKGIRQYPGPWLAKFSCLWFSREIFAARVQTSTKKLHERYGTFVRIGPNDISVCSPEALQTLYAHSPNALKSSLYDAFSPFGASRSVFNTTSRGDHARKRKLLSHMMAAKSLQEITPIIYDHERKFVNHWDEMCHSAVKGKGGTKGDCTWKADDGRAWFNAMPWFNYIAFDVIGDLAFGAPFGMLPAVKAETPVAESIEQAMNAFTSDDDAKAIQYLTINAIDTINRSSAFNSFIGSLPSWFRPHVMNLPFFKHKFGARKKLAAMAATAVSKRINSVKPILRADFLSKLLEGRDGNGEPMGKQELSSEALSLLVGGSDTVANSSAAIIYYLAQNTHIQRKLQASLDAALGPPDFSLSVEDSINDVNLTKLKDCEYLNNTINEGHRLHSTIGFGLPRVVPEGGLVVCGQTFKEGTTISTPVFALHRMKEIWGEDADLFNPERWEREDKSEMYRAFAPFSIGPRACLGRNLAQMEMQTFIGQLFHRYDVSLDSPDCKMKVHEAFVRKPESVYIGVKQRNVLST